MARYFKTELGAIRHFGKLNDWGCDMVEQCECCEKWTASAPDHVDGAINGINEEASRWYFAGKYCRICEACENKAEKEVGEWDYTNNPEGINPRFEGSNAS